MARHSKDKKQATSEIDALRRKVIEEFFDLKDNVRQHIEWSLAATVTCSSCHLDNGVHVPGKARDAEGKCAFCHATGIVPDKNQRNWATEEVYGRIAPAPKAMEFEDKTAENKSQIAKQLEKLPDSEFESRFVQLFPAIEAPRGQASAS